MPDDSKCPFGGNGRHAHTNRDWWPNSLDLSVLNLADTSDLFKRR